MGCDWRLCSVGSLQREKQLQKNHFSAFLLAFYIILLTPATNTFSAHRFMLHGTFQNSCVAEIPHSSMSITIFKMWFIPKSSCLQIYPFLWLILFYFWRQHATRLLFLLFKGFLILVPTSREDVLEMREKDWKAVWSVLRTRQGSQSPTPFFLPFICRSQLFKDVSIETRKWNTGTLFSHIARLLFLSTLRRQLNQVLWYLPRRPSA